MSAIEQRIRQLEEYRPALTGQADLEQFWTDTLTALKARALKGTRERVDTPYPYMEVFRVTFKGYDETPIHGWHILPTFAELRELPTLVTFPGYTTGKGFPEEYASWLLLGYSVFAVDVRGQGGETGNRLEQSYGMAKGWVTQGILSADSSYYRAVIGDCLKAVEWVEQQPETDTQKIAVMGSSQGGGLALLTAALSDAVSLCLANIPNMCHVDYGVFHSSSSLSEVAEFVHRFPEHYSAVMRTLSYFDVMNLAHRIQIPVLCSVGLKDTVCLPDTIYAAFNRITSPKKMCVYPFSGHHVGAYHVREMVSFLKRYFG